MFMLLFITDTIEIRIDRWHTHKPPVSVPLGNLLVMRGLPVSC